MLCVTPTAVGGRPVQPSKSLGTVPLKIPLTGRGLALQYLHLDAHLLQIQATCLMFQMLRL